VAPVGSPKVRGSPLGVSSLPLAASRHTDLHFSKQLRDDSQGSFLPDSHSVNHPQTPGQAAKICWHLHPRMSRSREARIIHYLVLTDVTRHRKLLKLQSKTCPYPMAPDCGVSSHSGPFDPSPSPDLGSQRPASGHYQQTLTLLG
jgi:hypothetical protein